jgi:hypothetical protein
VTTEAQAAITRLVDGLASPADRELADLFDRHASDQWAARDLQLDRYAADVCVICGKPDGPECSSCTAGWDQRITRSADV